MKISEIRTILAGNELDEKLRYITCSKDIAGQKERYDALLKKALSAFGDQEAYIITAPGRTEVCGNHTDHQLGKVLAASVNMDISAVAVKCSDEVEYISEGFKVAPVKIDDLNIHPEEKFTSEALIRGTLAAFASRGYKTGGFRALSDSEVLPGSGISSSAAFEVLIGTILSDLYNDGKIDPIEIAKIGQYAENAYFMKPCGLLDQMACSLGGFITIDFKDRENPKVEKIHFDFANSGLNVVLVNTKGDHADLSDEYGLMPKEMKEVAHALGKEVLSQCTMEEFMQNLKKIREQCSDRAMLRAIHYFNEVERVDAAVSALKKDDIETFKKTIIASGYSSYMYLQNVYVPKDYKTQNLSLALALSEQILKGRGAWRVHGGGLAGTIQAFVPHDLLDAYKKTLCSVYGEDACFVLSIRPVGGYQIV